jgi:hypothetical protein
MLGFARTSPPTYYYRRGLTREYLLPIEETDEQMPPPAIDWEPWQKMGISIDSERVQLVYVFNKLFVFWLEKTPFNDTTFKISTDDDESYSANSEQTKQAKLKIKFSFYNFNDEWITPQTVRANPGDPSDPESLTMVFERPKEQLILPFVAPFFTTAFSPRGADLVQFDVKNKVTLGEDTGKPMEVISLRLQHELWAWTGQITAGLDLDNPDPWWKITDFSLTDPKAKFPTQLGINPNEARAITLWGSHVEGSDTPPWLSFDAKGGSFLCRPPRSKESSSPGQIRGKDFSNIEISAAFSAGADLFVFALEDDPDVSDPDAKRLCYYHYFAAQNTWQEPVSVDDLAWPWGRLRGVFQQYPSKQIDNVVVAFDGRTYVSVGSHYFTYPASGYGGIEQSDITDLLLGPPALGALIGPAAVMLMSWSDSLANGRELVSVFKYVDDQGARVVLVTSAGGTPAHAIVDLNWLRNNVSGVNPFVDWGGLDAVFRVSQPDRVVFSRGDKLAILDWTDKSWSSGTLGALPGDATGLSAAFTGVDNKLYFFSGDHYAEADPSTLSITQMSLPVADRWGRPSLFSSLLTSVDGALMIRRENDQYDLYIFGKDKETKVEVSDPSKQKSYCFCYPNFTPAGLAALVLDHSEQNPPKEASKVWSSTWMSKPTMDVVTAAFERNGSAYLYWKRNSDEHAFMARYSPLPQGASPFSPDLGYPSPIPGAVVNLRADFYAEILSTVQTYAITRLTSHTAEQFSQRLFAGGIPKLLSLDTQQNLPELPRFTPLPVPGNRPAEPDELFVDTAFVGEYPGQGGSGLDFASSNGFYYREIFFHIPFLIAQTLKQGQRFSDALRWYEYVFDPTREEGSASYWQYNEFINDIDLTELTLQIKAYRDDPFDPHKIAELRPIAYRKAFVMSYIDNLLEWGDMLFRQYTRESLGEATMLYVRAADLLGKKPEDLGKRAMSQTHTYNQIRNSIASDVDDEILKLENGVPSVTDSETKPIPNDSIFNLYFYIPENDQFVDYWNRVGDRLFKIRHGLNIDGVKQALALFAPPVDVMALVRAFASGAGLAQALSDYNTPVPHYRFSFMFAKARELTGRLTQLGGALLSALEKKNAEELSLLRNTQERGILEMTLQIKEQQLEGARQSLAALQEGLKNAQTREAHYQKLLNEGLSVYETAQVTMMTIAQVHSYMSNVVSIASAVGSAVPQVGSPFAMTYGGVQVGGSLKGVAESWKTLAEIFNFGSSLSATLGNWDRRAQEWKLQKTLATGDTAQIRRQIRGAEIQVDVARREIQVQRRHIKNNLSVETFMKSKFTSQQLYQWMVGKLSAVYFQTYQLALDYAKAAQRALQFEMGRPEGDFQYIGVQYWDSLKKGLLAGEQLQLDLDRLEKAHIEKNQRRLEITKHISLMEVDPLALLKLKEKGSCEFDLSEALFDSDFPGHYCRQIKTLSLSFPAVVGPYDNFNATLTQLTHRTLLSPNKPALTYLLTGPSQQNGQDSTPAASVLRADWRPNQQVALSRGTNDSGLFQLNYQDERYLPFEGTGAVSTWRLEINGVDGHLHRETLTDVILTLQYTALSGGDAFAQTVKSAIGKKANDRAWLLNLAYDFPAEWQAFMSNPKEGLSFTVERRRLPGATGNKVTGVYLHYDRTEDPADDLSRQAVSLNGVVMKPGSSKTGLTLPLIEKNQDATQDKYKWRILPASPAAAKKFSRDNIRNIALVVTYSSKPSF